MTGDIVSTGSIQGYCIQNTSTKIKTKLSTFKYGELTLCILCNKTDMLMYRVGEEAVDPLIHFPI